MISNDILKLKKGIVEFYGTLTIINIKFMKITFLKKIIILNVLFLLCNCTTNETKADALQLSISTADAVTTTSANVNVTIANGGNSIITAKGICWSTSPNPTISLTTKTNDGIGTTAFNTLLNNLAPGTTYYVRAYATNSSGTVYSLEITFTTASLDSVTIGTQTWTTKNLDIITYRDGTPIPQVTNAGAWSNLTTGAWCYYSHDSNNVTIYGKLYNWYAVMGIHNEASLTNTSLRKQLAPQGWHVPSDTEWTTLTTFLGGEGTAGGKMKSTGTTLWFSPNTNATNSSGFSGIPAGYCLNNGGFERIGSNVHWWTTTETNSADAWSRDVNYNGDNVFRSYTSKTYGFSVRLLKD